MTALAIEDREAGVVTIWFALSAVVMIILVGLVVDLGGQVHAQQQARAVAAQAARTGAERIAAGPAIQGQELQLDAVAAPSAALAFVGSAGLTGQAQLLGTDVLEVRTAAHYTTRFLGIIGINKVTVTGRSSARIVRTIGGVER